MSPKAVLTEIICTCLYLKEKSPINEVSFYLQKRGEGKCCLFRQLGLAQEDRSTFWVRTATGKSSRQVGADDRGLLFPPPGPLNHPAVAVTPPAEAL
jgi:hypothetical protein